MTFGAFHSDINTTSIQKKSLSFEHTFLHKAQEQDFFSQQVDVFHHACSGRISCLKKPGKQTFQSLLVHRLLLDGTGGRSGLDAGSSSARREAERQLQNFSKTDGFRNHEKPGCLENATAHISKSVFVINLAKQARCPYPYQERAGTYQAQIVSADCCLKSFLASLSDNLLNSVKTHSVSLILSMFLAWQTPNKAPM